MSCFSQNKDELVLEFNNATSSYFIKANLSPELHALSFPPSFQRARKNNVDLFPEVILKKVINVFVFNNERSIGIQMHDSFLLIFKMHGAHANVLLAQNDSVISIFRNHLRADASIQPSALHRNIDFSKEHFVKNRPQLENVYFTFGKPVWQYLKNKGFENAHPDDQWILLQHTLQLLEKPLYYLLEQNKRIRLSLLPAPDAIATLHNPIEAANEFFYSFTKTLAFDKDKHAAIHSLTNRLQSCENYLKKNKEKLAEIEYDHHYQQWADLLMANLHRITTGATNVTLENFYDNNEPIKLKLKPELTAQKNAEVFYRKSKNQQIEIEKLQEGINKKETEKQQLTDMLQQVSQTTDLKTLRSLGASVQKQVTIEKKSLPFHEFEWNNFKIWVGKNAESNDELTLKYAFKEDLWLHAKDVSGSHVLIKRQAGKNFPKDVIERAAQLAAYNSKRKTDTLCPVVVTPKKFVRKRKGDPPGAVVVEREEVILVEPKLW